MSKLQVRPTFAVHRDPGNGRACITQKLGNTRVFIAQVYDPRDAQKIADALNGVNIIIDKSLGEIREVYADADLPQVNIYIVDFDPMGQGKLDFGFRWRKKISRATVTRVHAVIDRFAERYGMHAFITAFKRKLIRRPPAGQLYNYRQAPQA